MDASLRYQGAWHVAYEVYDFRRRRWASPEVNGARLQSHGLIMGNRVAIWSENLLLENYPISITVSSRVAGHSVIITVMENLVRRRPNRSFKLTFASVDHAVTFGKCYQEIVEAAKNTGQAGEIPANLWDYILGHAMRKLHGSR